MGRFVHLGHEKTILIDKTGLFFVDGRNPAPANIPLFTVRGLIYTSPGGPGFLPPTVWKVFLEENWSEIPQAQNRTCNNGGVPKSPFR